jgi:hypothetical protein
MSHNTSFISTILSARRVEVLQIAVENKRVARPWLAEIMPRILVLLMSCHSFTQFCCSLGTFDMMKW